MRTAGFLREGIEIAQGIVGTQLIIRFPGNTAVPSIIGMEGQWQYDLGGGGALKVFLHLDGSREIARQILDRYGREVPSAGEPLRLGYVIPPGRISPWLVLEGDVHGNSSMAIRSARIHQANLIPADPYGPRGSVVDGQEVHYFPVPSQTPFTPTGKLLWTNGSSTTSTPEETVEPPPADKSDPTWLPDDEPVWPGWDPEPDVDPDAPLPPDPDPDAPDVPRPDVPRLFPGGVAYPDPGDGADPGTDGEPITPGDFVRRFWWIAVGAWLLARR